jgi:hypothetical protein
MKKTVIAKMSIRVIFYLFIAIILFLNLINFIQFPKIDKPLTDSQIITIMKDKNLSLNPREEVLKAIKGEQLTTIEKSDKISSSFIFFDYIENKNDEDKNNQVIPLIYLLTLATFLIQAILLALSNYYKELREYFGEKKLDSIFLYTSEWTINAPPVLGVVGTIFSFGIVVSNISDISSLSTVFKENFANAALTTIIGGTVYVLNLCINIFIAKNLAIDK